MRLPNVMVLLTEKYKKVPLSVFAGAGKVIIAHIIDRERLNIAAADFAELMKNMEEYTYELRNEIHKLGIPTKRYKEWGKVEEKIKTICVREGIDKIVVFDRSLKHMKTNAKVVVI